jgi:hypothetical protein
VSVGDELCVQQVNTECKKYVVGTRIRLRV